VTTQALTSAKVRTIVAVEAAFVDLIEGQEEGCYGSRHLRAPTDRDS
jgi:hypothetical protein